MTAGSHAAIGTGATTRVARLVGASIDGKRDPDDFYATHPEAVRSLLEVERFSGAILEPACGDGAISKVLEQAGHTVISADLIYRGYGTGGLDFLLLDYPLGAPNAVTNPPFRLAEQFCRQALRIADRKVCMLLKLAFLEGQKRSAWLETTPLARVWVFRNRMSFARGGNAPEWEGRGGMIAYCWFIWEVGHSGPPAIGWIGRGR